MKQVTVTFKINQLFDEDGGGYELEFCVMNMKTESEAYRLQDALMEFMKKNSIGFHVEYLGPPQ